jgi:hypothetical protein
MFAELTYVLPSAASGKTIGIFIHNTIITIFFSKNKAFFVKKIVKPKKFIVNFWYICTIKPLFSGTTIPVYPISFVVSAQIKAAFYDNLHIYLCLATML